VCYEYDFVGNKVNDDDSGGYDSVHADSYWNRLIGIRTTTGECEENGANRLMVEGYRWDRRHVATRCV
jgi:hypothetical protein